MQAPCKDCPDRVLGCHSTCEKYIAFAQYRKEVLEKKQKEQNLIGDIIYARQKYKKRW